MVEKHFDLAGLASSVSRAQLTRRQMLKNSVVFGLGAVLLAACADDDDDDAVVDTDDDTDDDEPAVDTDDDDEEEPEPTEDDDEEVDDDDDTDDEPTMDDDRYGGELRIALIGEPPSLDIHMTSATVTTHVVMHMYETLFTWDSDFAAVPELVDTHEVSDDGMLNTLHLREGVLFHNGDEMTADDVYASIDRYANVVGVGFGEQLMGATEEMRVVDDYTLEFEMSEPFGTFTVVLARQNNGCAIYPQEVVEAAGSDAIEERIGTGPYRFVEHQPDRHILVERFEDYSYRDEEPNGYAGRKYAYADSIRFVPVPDEAARVAGLQAGDYDYLEGVTTEQFEAMDGDPNVVVEVGPPTGNDQVILNMDQGIMSENLALRRAVQAAMDCEQILTAAWGADYFRLDPGQMWQETVWHSTVGEDRYNMADPELAEEYLEEAGYDGEEIRLITTQEYMDMYNTAAVLEQQLTDIGMTVDTRVFDWSTLLETRGDTAEWDLAITGFSFRVDPTQLPFVRCEWGGRWCADEKVELVNSLFSEVEFEDRLDAWEGIQELMYDTVPLIKTGEGLNLLAYSPRVNDLDLILLAPAYWNVWIDE